MELELADKLAKAWAYRIYSNIREYAKAMEYSDPNSDECAASFERCKQWSEFYTNLSNDDLYTILNSI